MKKRWFTLVEMLIVIVIIGILAAALLPQIGSARDKANDTAREANVRTLVTAITQYWMDHPNGYPTGNQTNLNSNWPAAGDDLTKYGVPADNFHDTPGGSEYNYTKLKWDHFIVSVNLSCDEDTNPTCGNCSGALVRSYNSGDVRTEAHFLTGGATAGDSFCQIQ